MDRDHRGPRADRALAPAVLLFGDGGGRDGPPPPRPVKAGCAFALWLALTTALIMLYAWYLNNAANPASAPPPATPNAASQ